MEIEDRVLVFIRYFNLITNKEKTAIGGMDINDYLYMKDCVKNKEQKNFYHTSQMIKEMQIIKSKFIPVY